MQKRKKSIRRAVLLLTLAVILTGCGQGKEFDPPALAKALLDGMSFDEELMPLAPEDAERLYGVAPEDVLTVVAYIGTGATVDEFSAWKAADADAAIRIEEKISDRIALQREGYLDYKPEEVPKLDRAVVVKKGSNVALCISGDPEPAQTIISEFME